MFDRFDPAGMATVISDLCLAAPDEDAGSSIEPSMARLLETGWLSESDPTVLCRMLVAVAEANLSAARLAEGHVNARQLLALHGGRQDDATLLWGVWGADGAAPLGLRQGRLIGGKRYASGLGFVDRAIVTVSWEETSRLAVLDVTDTARHRPETWRMSGMRATRSGDVDLTGMRPEWLGEPGDYYREPYFVGGVWRIAALQLGGTFGLLGAARDWLNARDRLAADAQVARIGPLIGRGMAAFGLIEQAAEVASGSVGRDDPDLAVMLSAQARLLTEELAQDAIIAVERSIGMAHFEENAATGRMARDLATYCRQAARDAFEQRAGRIALSRSGPLSELWHG
ncbi:acyl-CoA dehydrogenase [uncultured Jannaschia sp.]|uniref:acyl-CoA dehydrogenase n=1 Tax=uncultured Jannaschia sp. TaxID=293347 RepID=UPI0026309320|nr:acyl-CoA dehydrogenase [uncultured Jannaschia sp.]